MFSLFRKFFNENEIVQGFSANKCDLVHKILPQLTLKYRNTSEENLIVRSTLGFATMGLTLAANLDIPPLLHDSDLQFRPLCSNTATVNNFGGRYTQRSIVCIGFSDHPVVEPRENSLSNLTTPFKFSDLDLCDGGWS